MFEIKLVKYVDKTKTYTNKEGKEFPTIRYFIEYGTKHVQVQPRFNEDYKVFDVLSTTFIKEIEDKKDSK